MIQATEQLFYDEELRKVEILQSGKLRTEKGYN